MNGSHQKKIDYLLRPPPHPLTGRAIYGKLRSALERECGHKLTLKRLGLMLGKEASTAGYWFEVCTHPHALGLVCMLERLSDDGRHRFTRSVCRSLPTILHPSLAHSPKTVADLLETLQNPCGITLIRGSATLRRYLVSALGHTFHQLHPRHKTAAGLDIGWSEELVPVETMLYLQSLPSGEPVRSAITAAWSRIQRSGSPLVLVNGVWSAAAPAIQQEIVECAKVRNVIIADAALPGLNQLAKQGIRPLQLLTLSPGDPSQRIQVARQEWQPAGRPVKKSR